MDPATPLLRGPDTWTDIQGLSGLRRAAREDSQSALPAVARQFEAVFTQMLVKSMRDASFGGGILDSQQSGAWHDMFDKQIALSLAHDGHGMGIAAMLVRQLGERDRATAADGDAALASPVPAAMPLPARGAQSATAGGIDAAAQYRAAEAGFLERAADFIADVGQQAVRSAGQLAISGPADFVRTLAPYARAAADKLGVSVRAVLAQAALETGWGKHMPQHDGGGDSFNLFGIKAGGHWDGDRVTAATREFEHGAATTRNADFRAYDDPLQSFSDYVRLLTDNARYAGALGRGEDVAGFARALHHAGYATDPDYAAKLTAIADGDTMRQALASLKDSLPTPTPEL